MSFERGLSGGLREGEGGHGKRSKGKKSLLVNEWSLKFQYIQYQKKQENQQKLNFWSLYSLLLWLPQLSSSALLTLAFGCTYQILQETIAAAAWSIILWQKSDTISNHIHFQIENIEIILNYFKRLRHFFSKQFSTKTFLNIFSLFSNDCKLMFHL